MGRPTARPAPPADLRRLLKRSEFLRAARGNRAGRSAFLLQAAPTEPPEPGIGFTVTKKTGNAPERNRIKRRLRAAARACEGQFMASHDYVLVGRREALGIKFDQLVSELRSAITRIHASKAQGRRDDS